jgi:hypothetical protein
MKSRPLWTAVILWFYWSNLSTLHLKERGNQEALLTTTYNYSPWVEISCLQHSIVLDTRYTQTAVGMGSSRNNCNIPHKIAPCKGHASFPEGEHTAACNIFADQISSDMEKPTFVLPLVSTKCLPSKFTSSCGCQELLQGTVLET